MSHASAPRRVRLAALALGLPLCIAGCGSEEEPQLVERDLVTLSPTPETPSGRAPSATSRPAQEGTAASEPAIAAAEVGRSTVGEGIVTTVERVDGAWEVTVVRPTGRQLVVTVPPEGSPSVRRESDDDAAEAATEARLLARTARLDLATALQQARTVVPRAVLTKVELDQDDGVVRYEADFEGEDDVLVDARSGEVSRED